MKRFPVVTFAIVGLAVLIHLVGGDFAGVLEWRYDWARRGEIWRPITGHLCHWSDEHLFWDSAMFVLLGGILESYCRPQVIATLAGTTLLTEPVLVMNGDYAAFRGLSAWAMGLAALGLLKLWAVGARRKSRFISGVGIAGLIVLVLKIGFELIIGSALFVSSGDTPFVVAAETHAAGVASALLVGCAWAIWSRVSSRGADGAKIA